MGWIKLRTLLRSFCTISLLPDIPLRNRHASTHTEGTARYFQTGGGLSAFVFIEIDATLYPAHRFFLEPLGDDFWHAQIVFNIQSQNRVQHIVWRKGVLVLLFRTQFCARRFFNGGGRNNLAFARPRCL